MGEHWTDGFEHESVTDENREAFNTHMSKFPTEAAAVMDGYDLAKQKGQAFKLPESIDKLPDDASRATLLAQVNKLYGREYAADIDGLADLDMKSGSTAEDSMYDEDLAKVFKEWIVGDKIDKATAQKAVKFHNEAMGRARALYAAKTEEDVKKSASEQLAAVAACNDVLIAKFGSKEKLDEQTVLMHRALVNETGCTADEAADVAEFLKDREGSTNATVRRLLISNLAPLAAESTVHGPGGPNQPAPVEQQDGVTEQVLWPKKK